MTRTLIDPKPPWAWIIAVLAGQLVILGIGLALSEGRLDATRARAESATWHADSAKHAACDAARGRVPLALRAFADSPHTGAMVAAELSSWMAYCDGDVGRAQQTRVMNAMIPDVDVDIIETELRAFAGAEGTP